MKIEREREGKKGRERDREITKEIREKTENEKGR